MNSLTKQIFVIASLMIVGLITVSLPITAEAKKSMGSKIGPSLWPDAAASKIVSLARTGKSEASILVQTQRVAVKETGPKVTVAKFGEVYDWSPAFFAVHQNEPTQIKFWNLQPDDYHTFELMSPEGKVLMNLVLPPLSHKSYVFTFHEQGLYKFICPIHQPDMNGQILVLPSARRG